MNPFVCHWLEASDVCLAFIHRNNVLRQKGDERESYKGKCARLKKHIREFPDMIMHIGHDGTLSVWGIQASTIGNSDFLEFKSESCSQSSFNHED